VKDRFDRIDRVIDKSLSALAFVSIAASAAILVATIGNIVMRAAFNIALNGAIEVSTEMMPVVAFCAMPLITFYGAHIKVDLLTRHFPRMVQKALRLVNLLLIAGISLIVSYYVLEKGFQQKELGASGSSLHIPYYPFYYLISAMMLLVALCVLYSSVRLITTGVEPGEPLPPETLAEAAGDADAEGGAK
jgi:TRAP-type C4-dicarboxylate transport system permease small subunit